MTQKFTPAQKKLIRDNVSADKISFCKDSTQLEIRSGFFYKHERTTETTAAKFLKQLQDLKLNVAVVNNYPETAEYFNTWPRSSYFQVTFELVETA